MENFSRREFFKKFVPKSSEKNEDISAPEVTNTQTEQTTLSRRDFLKFISAIGVVATTEQIGIKTAQAQENQKTTGAEQGDKEHSYTKTIIEQSLIMGASVIADTILEKLKIEHGNKILSEEDIIEYFRDKPIKGLLEVGILGPVVEEALFRALPSRGLINKKDARHRWDIGIPTSLLFALGHNLKIEESGELRFIKSVPVSAFMGGLFYWYLMREKGYSHAAIAHSMNNTIPMSIGILLFKAYPEEKAEEIVKKYFKSNRITKFPGKVSHKTRRRQ